MSGFSHRYLASSYFLEDVLGGRTPASRLQGIMDAKRKNLTPRQSNSDVSSADAYQMKAYASSYQCNRIALVYLASHHCPPGHVRDFQLHALAQPILDVVAVDIHELAFGDGIPAGLERTVPLERSAVRAQRVFFYYPVGRVSGLS